MRALIALVCVASLARADNWPGWRGPTHDGISTEKKLPLKWSATENVRWKAPLTGAGVSQPVVWGKRVFVTASDGRLNDRLTLSCHDADSGKLLWRSRYFGSALSDGQFPPGGMAVPTPTTDGKHVWALFGTGELVCLDVEGRPVWIRSLAQEYGPFRNRWGMAASPLLVGELLVIQVDHFAESYLLAVEATTGKNRWRVKREATVGWSSPLPVKTRDKTQLVVAGTYTLRGYDLESGKELWKSAGMHMQPIPTPVAFDGRLFCLCGEDLHALCFSTEGKQEWKVRANGCYIPSPIAVGGRLYYAEDNGFAVCLDTATGKRVWRGRLVGKQHASPVYGDDKIYFTGEGGVVTVVKPGAEFEELSRNDIGETVVASPAIANGRLFLRGAKHLFCVGAP